MKRSILIRVLSIWTFLFALMLSAAPIDYIPADSIGVININTAEIIAHPLIQSSLLPMVQGELTKNGFSATDLNATVAVGVALPSADPKDFRITAVAESVNPIAAKVFNLIYQQSKDTLKLTKVDGKRAFTDNDSRLIVMSSNMLLAQFSAKPGTVHAAPKTGKNMLNTRAEYRQYSISLIMDIAKIADMIPKEALESAGANFSLKDFRIVFCGIKLQPDGGVKADFETQCASPAVAGKLSKQFADARKQLAADPTFGKFVQKVVSKTSGNAIRASITLSAAEVQELFLMAIMMTQNQNQTPAPAQK